MSFSITRDRLSIMNDASPCIDRKRRLEKCTMCPRACATNRLISADGFCKAGDRVEVYAAHLHFGEEPPISGTGGSGTIFFSHCNMRCVYCQNYKLSQLSHGKEMEIEDLARLMLSLQRQKAHNINFVTPTHFAAHVADAVLQARERGLIIPIVYNSGGYESIETLKFLDGLVDIYLVDMRYGDNGAAATYSSCPDYVEVNQAAVLQMYKQVGNLKLAPSGIAERGVIIRHLLLPNNLSGLENIFRFISEKLNKETYISFMSQYYPAYKAASYEEIARGINRKEYDGALSSLYRYNLKNGWIQEYLGGYVDSGFAGTNIEPDV